MKIVSPWDDAKVGVLKTMWEGGCAASAIAKELGVTRNAVIGKAHRLNLYRKKKVLLKAEGKAKAAKSNTPKAARLWVKPRPPAAWQKRPTEIVMPDKSKQIPLMDAKVDQCRAIVGYNDGKLDQAICCGEEVTVNRFTGAPISWCAYHHSIYFEPPKDSRDARNRGRVAPNWSARRSPQVQPNPQAVKKSA